MRLRLGATLERSRANGPGGRFVVWVRGCSLACRGCFNPQLWTSAGGSDVDPANLAEQIARVPTLRGVTVSGGEPLQQAEAVCSLLRLLPRSLDSVVYSGYTFEEISRDPVKARILQCADFLVAGRYLQERKSDANGWYGSSNKTLHALTGRIQVEEEASCRLEALIRADGGVLLTGFPDPALRGGAWTP